jgi:phenylacetate-coenzyme A ligase PaaK-like adenylate-forming protein
MNLQSLFDVLPYSLSKYEKAECLSRYLTDLTQHHYQHSGLYKKMMDSIGYLPQARSQVDEIPFLPVRLFKMFDLYSVPKENIIKTMTSSGTSGQTVSKIYLDKITSQNQSKALTKIVSDILGSKRTPMLIIDSATVLKNRNMFSARGAGILGFSIFGSKRAYALNDNMELAVEQIIDFLSHNKHKQIFLFGFTFMVYQHFIKQLKRLKDQGIQFDLSNGILIHGGGWKKLISESMPPNEFREELYQLSGIKSVHDYYGMVEQTGSIYMECEKGHLHASIFSDIIIRNPHDFSCSPIGEKGIIQTLSVLPTSYPGHSLLTEDEGVMLGEDDCQCGRLGKYFKVVGRIQNAEIRGCSDTYAEKF